MAFIDLDKLSFQYDGEEKPVFTNFSLSMERGECLVINGDNGSGKTTLFRILNGLNYPQEGSYFYDGMEVTKEYLAKDTNSRNFHKRIGYLFQNPDVMLFNSNVYDEIAFGPRQMGLEEEIVARRVEDLLEIFEISSLAEKAPYHLSGGQKKRVAFAAVLAMNPETLVLDEPYAGLDQKMKEMLKGLLSELKASGKTILMVTHDSSLTEGLADRCIELG